MKDVKEDRFQKPEDIDFIATPIQESSPSNKEALDKPPKDIVKSDRTNVRTIERTPQTVNVYAISLPENRRKIRHAFDIFEDHLDALKKIQMAERELYGNQGIETLGDLIREGLDILITKKSKDMKNIEILDERNL